MRSFFSQPETDSVFVPRRLVVFDLDGTLYRQRPVRLRMLQLLLADAVRRREYGTVKILQAYRRIREELAELRQRHFEPLLLSRTAAACGVPEAVVQDTVKEWMFIRPLPLLAQHRVRGAQTIFSTLRSAGTSVGVLSDYPASAKLAALELEADYVVSAHDADVAVQKPDPSGLLRLMVLAGCRANEAVMIGDRPERDGAAAAELGMAFVQVGSPLVTPYSRRNRVVRDLRDCRLNALGRGNA